MSEFKFQFMISCGGAPEVPLESLSPEEKTQAAAVMTKRLSDTLSDYYTLHPDEFAALDI